jgi:DMSO/TMAO reductase YedYZ heme-binding membrane subunit
MLDKILKLLDEIILKGKIYIPRKVITSIAYYIVPIVLFVMYLIPSLHEELQSDLGEIAYYLLLITVFVKPLRIIFRQIGLLKTVGSYRRQLGIATFYFAIFHFLFYAKEIYLSPITLLKTLWSVPSLAFGAIGLISLFILAITSNKFSTMKLKRNWKKLHKLVYLAFPIILIHISLMEGEGYLSAILIILAYFLLKRREKQLSK